MGITNDLFGDERDSNPRCAALATQPNSITNTEGLSNSEVPSAIEQFGFFMRFLAPPAPSATLPGGSTSINIGRQLFTSTGCALCHTRRSGREMPWWRRSPTSRSTCSPTC
jgi:hypothetical protein